MTLEGTVLAGRYRLEQLLGQGGFGVVYRATQIPLGRAVAVKLMQASLGDDGTRFAQEAALAQRLEHPNTVRILDFGVLPDGRPFIVWELLRGETVAELVARSGPLSPAIVRRIGVQVLKSLMEAHAHGVIHRDIKPANVFVSAHPGEPYFVKVLDFGIAKDVAQKSPIDPGGRTLADWSNTGAAETRGGQLMGTPLYMAPEQALAQPVGPETDVYAVGLLIAEMLAGRPVFSGTDGMQVLLAQASPDPVPLPAVVTAGPLAAVTLRATRKVRTERHATAAVMLAELEAVRGLDESALTTLQSASGLTGGSGSQGPAATLAGPVADQATLLAPAITRADRTAPPMQMSAGPSAPARSVPRTALVLGVVVTLVGLVATGGYFATQGAASRRASAPDQEESDAEPEDSAAVPRGKKRKPGPPANTDWAKRKPLTIDQAALTKALESDGYKITKVTEYGAGTGYAQVVTSVTKAPCAGTVFTYKYDSEALAEGARKSLASQPTMRVFISGTSILAVVLGSLDKPEGEPVCTDTLAYELTR